MGGGTEELRDRMRGRIVGQIHVGRLRPGDRLPSIRQLATGWEVDHRAVAAAYRALAEEGLVEVRAGSGVYVAAGAQEGALPGTERWLAGILLEGWSRRMSRGEVGAVVRRCAETPLRCALVESNEDSMLALAAELEDDFGLGVVPIPVPADSGPPDAERLARADLVVTSTFHAEAVRTAAARAGVPAVVAVVSPDFVDAIERRFSAGRLTVVIADPDYRARGEAFLRETAHTGRVRFVPVAQLRYAVPRVELDDDRSVLLTRAARCLMGLPEFHLLPPPFRLISPESAADLSRVIARLTHER